jgi:hypothetical protein
MTFISSTKLAESLNHRADARLPSTIQRWPGRNSREILPGPLLNSVIAGVAFAIRQLPGMATFSPMILSMVIGIAFHNIVGTAAWGQTGRDIQSPPASSYRHHPARASIDFKPGHRDRRPRSRHYRGARRPTMRFDTTSKVVDDSTTVELALERRAVINCLRRCEAVTQILPPSQVG